MLQVTKEKVKYIHVKYNKIKYNTVQWNKIQLVVTISSEYTIF